MKLKTGIVGLPNVGKSTLFNALTGGESAQAANFPFCTIEPNTGIVELKDQRLVELASLHNSKAIIQATIEFVDIAGIVKGASTGEGLGNKFLSNIRECDAIVHVVRCFEDENIIHVDGSVDAVRDVEVRLFPLPLCRFQQHGARGSTVHLSLFSPPCPLLSALPPHHCPPVCPVIADQLLILGF